ncbi:MAG: hypothetical protein VX278_15465 [Myxococcota bacterium]|nr:hypothetical protein [Myxococcota bacterium]
MFKMMVVTGLLGLCLFSPNAWSCCAEQHDQLFPLGEQDGEPVFLSFQFSRRCQSLTPKKRNLQTGMEDGNEFWIKGTFSLVRWRNGEREVLETLGSIDEKECTCTYAEQEQRSRFESFIEPYYQKALARFAESNSPIRPVSIAFNDRKNTKIIESEDGIIVQYKEITLDFSDAFFPFCEPSRIQAVRRYESRHHHIQILRTSCSWLDKKDIPRNTKRFLNLKTGFWGEKASPHGELKDYVFIQRKPSSDSD